MAAEVGVDKQVLGDRVRLVRHWATSHECSTEFRYTETLNKAIVILAGLLQREETIRLPSGLNATLFGRLAAGRLASTPQSNNAFRGEDP